MPAKKKKKKFSYGISISVFMCFVYELAEFHKSFIFYRILKKYKYFGIHRCKEEKLQPKNSFEVIIFLVKLSFSKINICMDK